MRRTLLGWIVVVSTVAPVAAWAATSVGVHVGISDGPATLRVTFQNRPDVQYVRESDVYVVDDDRCPDDMFRYRDTWWVVRDEHWYRARDWHGTFVRVRERDVPEALWRVPDRHWKHHPHGMPPGLAKKMDRDARWADDDRGRGRGHEKVRERDRDRDRDRD